MQCQSIWPTQTQSRPVLVQRGGFCWHVRRQQIRQHVNHVDELTGGRFRSSCLTEPVRDLAPYARRFGTGEKSTLSPPREFPAMSSLH